MLPLWGAPLAVLAVSARLFWLNARPNGPLPMTAKVLTRLTCPLWPTAKDTIWLAAGSVTSMALPSGLNDIVAGVAALALGRGCVAPTIGTSVFDCCASGTIRKPVMFGAPPTRVQHVEHVAVDGQADGLRPS